MSTVKRWLSALFSLEPIPVTAAVGLLAVGAVGAVTIREVLPQPSEPFWVGIWLIGMAASIYLLVRGAIALLAIGWGNVGRPATSWVGERLPFEVRSPVVRKEAVTEEPPLGVLDFEKATDLAVKRIVRIFTGLTKDLVEATGMFQVYTPRFAGMVNASTDRKVSLAREFAKKLDRFADKFEAHQRGFRVERERLVASFLPRLESFTQDTDLPPLRDAIKGMRDSTVESRQSVRNYRAAVITMRGTNLHQSLNRAVDRLLTSVTELLVDYDATVDFGNEALKVIEGKIPKPVKPLSKKAERRGKR